MNLTRKDGADAALKLLIAARGTLYNIDAGDHAAKVTEAIESIQGEFWPEQVREPVSWVRPLTLRDIDRVVRGEQRARDDEETYEAREADKDDLHPITRAEME